MTILIIISFLSEFRLQPLKRGKCLKTEIGEEIGEELESFQRNPCGSSIYSLTLNLSRLNTTHKPIQHFFFTVPSTARDCWSSMSKPAKQKLQSECVTESGSFLRSAALQINVMFNIQYTGSLQLERHEREVWAPVWVFPMKSTTRR